MEHELQRAMFEVPDSFDVHTVLMDGDIDSGKLLYVCRGLGGWGGGGGVGMNVKGEGGKRLVR